MRDQFEAIKLLGGGVVGVSTSTTEEIEQSAHARSLPFALLSDPTLRLIRQHGLATFDEGEQRWVSRPAVVIVDGKRIIRFAHVGEHTRDRPAVGAILLALERIRDGSA